MGAHAETSSAAIVTSAIVNSAIVNSAIVDSAIAGSGMAESVIETVKRMNDEACGLLDRRSEINRRIRELYQRLHGLNSPSINEERFVDTVAKTESQASRRRAGPLPHGASPGERIASENLPLHSPMPKHAVARLRRACRIALLEAGGEASLEEIRALIMRRGSFAFVESESSCTAILHALRRMRDCGEIRRVKIGAEPVWERIPPVERV